MFCEFTYSKKYVNFGATLFKLTEDIYKEISEVEQKQALSPIKRKREQLYNVIRVGCDNRCVLRLTIWAATRVSAEIGLDDAAVLQPRNVGRR